MIVPFTFLVLPLTAFALSNTGHAKSKRVTQATVFDCESAPRFIKHLQLKPLQTVREGSESCVRVRDAKSRWLVTAMVRDDGDESGHFVYLQLDDRGRKLDLTRSPTFKSEHTLTLKAVADFDGDGISEIIGEEIVHSQDSVSTNVVVLAPRPSGTVRLLKRRVEFKVNVGRYTGDQDGYNQAELSCKSQYSVTTTDGRAVVVVSPGVLTRQKNVPRTASLSEEFCKSRTTSYRWNGDKIAATIPDKSKYEIPPSNDGACPPQRYIAKALRLRAGETTDGPVRCLRGRFPRPALVVAAVIGDGSETEAGEVIIAGIDNKNRLSFRHRLSEYSDPTGVYETYKLDRLVDLNGDRTDEILLQRNLSTPASSGDSLLALGLRGKTLRKLLERDLGSVRVATFGGRGEHDYRPVKPEDAIECKAMLTVEHRKGKKPLLVITRSLAAGKNVRKQQLKGVCTPGRETFVLRAGRLKEVR